MSEPLLDSARRGDSDAFARLVSPHLRELRAHCYRMSGSMSAAEDLLQDSLIRAWKGLASFEGRSTLRTWLYRVTTHACLDGLDTKSARVLPFDLGPPSTGDDPPVVPPAEQRWIEPCSEETEDALSPEARYDARESVALAFLAALQQLPAKQRAVLILRDVLGWEASECADLLGMTLASVTSALQRARESVDARSKPRNRAAPAQPDEATARLLARYVRAWEMADVTELVSLLHEDATLCMPPLPFWLRGPRAIGASLTEMVLTAASVGTYRLVRTRANGGPALASYKRDGDGVFRLNALQLLEVGDGRIVAITAFLDPSAFAAFSLPAALPDDAHPSS